MNKISDKFGDIIRGFKKFVKSTVSKVYQTDDSIFYEKTNEEKDKKKKEVKKIDLPKVASVKEVNINDYELAADDISIDKNKSI